MNEYLKSIAFEIGNRIEFALNDNKEPKDYGFMLFIFPFDDSDITYTSNAKREDMIKVLNEFLKKASA